MEIVAFTPNDIAEIMSIQTECGLSPWTRRGYELELKRPDSVMLAVKGQDNNIAGFIVGRAVRSADQRSTEADAEIYNIGTRRVFRSKGVGSMLMNRFLQICTERGITRVLLEVRASNANAIKFYQSYGFKVTATRRSFYTAPVEDALIMTLLLGYLNKAQRQEGA